MAPPPGGATPKRRRCGTSAPISRASALAFLLTSPAVDCRSSSPTAARPNPTDGKADVVDAKGPGSFAARLFFDKKTHRPLMLSYRGVAPRVIDADAARRTAPPAAAARTRTRRRCPPPQIVDIQLFLDDYKPVDGVMLPHHISRSIDGKPTEEMTFKTIKINPAFKPDTFAAK